MTAMEDTASPAKQDRERMATVMIKYEFEDIEQSKSLQIEENSNQRTRNQFRPRPGGKQGTTSYQLRQYAEATLGGGSLRKIVKLPEGEDENEWLAVNSRYYECPHKLDMTLMR